MVRERKNLVLPMVAISSMDVGNLLREVEELNNFMQQTAIRKPGTTMIVPKISKMCEDLIELNNLNMLVVQDRKQLLSFLANARLHAPQIHMSFSSEPSAQSLKQLMAYLRKEIHPNVLLQVGLQPAIGGGCVVRTTNKFFDYSLRKHFLDKRDLLVAALSDEAKATGAKS